MWWAFEAGVLCCRSRAGDEDRGNRILVDKPEAEGQTRGRC
jgi:hypothetical protein